MELVGAVVVVVIDLSRATLVSFLEMYSVSCNLNASISKNVVVSLLIVLLATLIVLRKLLSEHQLLVVSLVLSDADLMGECCHVLLLNLVSLNVVLSKLLLLLVNCANSQLLTFSTSGVIGPLGTVGMLHVIILHIL